MRSTQLLGICLFVVVALPGCGGAEPAAKITPRATMIGVNLSTPSWPSGQRAFANLAIGDVWQIVNVPKNWSAFPRENVLPDGGIAALPPGSNAVRFLTRPDTGRSGADIHCSWQGSGHLFVKGGISGISSHANGLSFHWYNTWKDGVWLQVDAVDAKNPIHGIDCRETTMAPNARFDPTFVDSLTGFKVIRFMDWGETNQNNVVTWAGRTRPDSIETNRGSGVAIEDLVALAIATKAAPWFCMPWNADRDYITRFAQYVHDQLPASQMVYVETGNEIWNAGFPASKQATSEGLAEKLSDNPRQANLYRLAERTVEVMKIWERVFSDRPKQLVRVISTQHVLPDSAAQILGNADTAAHVDALATAPYFGYDLMHEGQTQDLTEIFRRLDDEESATIVIAEKNRQVASRFGKRYIAYEAGQHIVKPDDLPLTTKIQRDPRMYGVYKRYINDWRSRVGDTLTLFSNVGGIGPFGAWGLSEHSGQPISEAPKLRAVLEEQKR